MSAPDVQLSALDTARFGIQTARANVATPAAVEDIFTFCRRYEVVLLIVRCPVDSLATAQQLEMHGCLLMDTLLYLQRNLVRLPLPDECSGLTIRAVVPADISAVEQVAAAAFQDYTGHYHADSKLDRSTCDDVYVSWAVRSCLDRTVADEVLVAEQDGQIVGFGVLNQPDPTTGDGRLYGVAPAFRRRGIYRALMVRSLEWCRKQGCSRMRYSTQIMNSAPQNMCVRLGFEMSHAYYTFHKWFDENLLQ
jgi:GNAT superfamily N-acetyltransferase